MVLLRLPAAICSLSSLKMPEVEVLMTGSVDLLVEGPASAWLLTVSLA